MSEGGWDRGGWDEDGRREALPRLEDLPIADQGYDREAVRQAFDDFYRHAAQLDSTLRVLESVEVFGRQARELRADIRSLRAASWGPAPSARHVWSVGHEVWSPQEPPAAFSASLPRLAVWAALIVAVGVGAALAELSTVLIVLLVVAAWALVALIEVAIASRRAGAEPVPLAPPADPVAAPVAAPPPELAPAPAAQETMIVPADERVDELQEVEADREPVVAAPAEGEPMAAPATDPVAESGTGVAEELVTEPEPVAGVETEAPRRRFWRRRAEPSPADTDGFPVTPAAWRSEAERTDPWEAGQPDQPDADPPDQQDAEVDDDTSVGLEQPLVTAQPPSRGLLRRGRR